MESRISELSAEMERLRMAVIEEREIRQAELERIQNTYSEELERRICVWKDVHLVRKYGNQRIRLFICSTMGCIIIST